MPRLSRRGILLGAAAAAGVTSVAAISHLPPSSLARAMLERLVGFFRMDELQLDAVIADYESSAGYPAGLKRGLLRVAQAVPGGPDLLARLPDLAERHERLERGLLTSFLTTTSFLREPDRSVAPIVYVGRSACSSPFARFDLD